MSYTALYRKFRPLVFEDVKGQEHIVTTLKNQLQAKRIGHAYLFCGTRGTGKTTIAKIFAKAVNCEHPVDGSPCGCCSSCQEVANGNSMNVIEIDAASNNGVDHIRTIIEEVAYAPTTGNYKVYIIDEVHMLSLGAFNALLKTLEEPPAYVIFILATTEPHKIPVTIHSRCQRYDFKRITIDTIADRLKELTQLEGMQIEDAALRYIAKCGDGSMRDALSLLDQCNAFHYGQLLTYDKVLDVLGAMDIEIFHKLYELLLQRDIIGGVQLLEQIVMQGRELSQFVTDFTWYLRNLMLLHSTKEQEDGRLQELLDVSTENLKLLRKDAEASELSEIIRYLGIFSELSEKMRYATQKRIFLEMTLIKLCCPQMEVNTDALLERVRKVEKDLENAVLSPPVRANYPADAGAGQDKAAGASAPPVPLPSAIPEDLQRLVREWPQVVGMTDALLKSVLGHAKLSLGEQDTLLICVPNKVEAGQLEQKKEEISALLNHHIGKEVSYAIRVYEKEMVFNEQYVDLSAIVHMDIEEEE